MIEDEKTGGQFQKRSRFLVSGVGALSNPKTCDIPGAENFTGRLFHSARWDHSFDYKDKEVVCVGKFNFLDYDLKTSTETKKH